MHTSRTCAQIGTSVASDSTVNAMVILGMNVGDCVCLSRNTGLGGSDIHLVAGYRAPEFLRGPTNIVLISKFMRTKHR